MTGDLSPEVRSAMGTRPITENRRRVVVGHTLRSDRESRSFKSMPRFYILIFVLILVGFSWIVIMRPKAKQITLHKTNQTSTVQKTENFWLFLSIILLIAGEAAIIFILFKKSDGETVAELSLESQKMTIRNEELIKQITMQKDEKMRLANEIQDKEKIVQSVTENEKLLSINFSRLKNEVDDLRTEKDNLAKQLQEKRKELLPARRARLKKRG